MNTVSNLAFVFVGIYLIGKARRDGATGVLRLMGPMAVLIGLFSGMLHATMTQWGNFLDLASMYLLGTLFLFLNLRRWRSLQGKPLRDRRELGQYVLANLGLMVLHGFWKEAGVPAFGVLVALFNVFEILLWMRKPALTAVNYYWCWVSSGLFAVSLGVWSLDLTRIWCQPESIVQGHALWHVGCALSIITMYCHFRQFRAVVAV